MLLARQVQFYKNLFSKSFFFDKFFFNNVYQYPKFRSLKIKFFLSPTVEYNKIKFCKIISLFYLLTGQRPQFLIKNCNLKSVKRKKLLGFVLTMPLSRYNYFFDYLIQRQFALMTSSVQTFRVTSGTTFTVEVPQKVQDDDMMFQILKVTDFIRYRITVTSASLSSSHFQSLLISFKVPLCKINSYCK